jgi:hypothetical protein
MMAALVTRRLRGEALVAGLMGSTVAIAMMRSSVSRCGQGRLATAIRLATRTTYMHANDIRERSFASIITKQTIPVWFYFETICEISNNREKSEILV